MNGESAHQSWLALATKWKNFVKSSKRIFYSVVGAMGQIGVQKKALGRYRKGCGDVMF